MLWATRAQREDFVWTHPFRLLPYPAIIQRRRQVKALHIPGERGSAFPIRWG
jgi:hypothetical protein